MDFNLTVLCYSKSFDFWHLFDMFLMACRKEPKSVTNFNLFTFFIACMLSNQKPKIAILGF